MSWRAVLDYHSDIHIICLPLDSLPEALNVPLAAVSPMHSVPSMTLSAMPPHLLSWVSLQKSL